MVVFDQGHRFANCNAKRHRIGPVPHKPKPNVIGTTESKMSPRSTAMRQFRRSSLGQRPRLGRSDPVCNLGFNRSGCLPEQRAFFVRQCNCFIGPRVRSRIISAIGCGEGAIVERINQCQWPWPISRASSSRGSAPRSRSLDSRSNHEPTDRLGTILLPRPRGQNASPPAMLG